MEYLKNTIGYQMISLIERMLDVTKAEFQKIGITNEDYISLHYVYENPGIKQSELAKMNRKDQNVISKRIDKLEQKDLVKRVRSDNERRAFSLYVTESGNKIIQDYWQVFLKGESTVLEKLTEEEQMTLKLIFKKLME